MKKRVLLSALALTFGLALTACGNSGSDKAADTGSKSETEAAKADGAKADGDVFTIGSTGPLTGAAASYGNSVKNGATVAKGRRQDI